MHEKDFAGLQYYTPENVPHYEHMETATIRSLDKLAVSLGLKEPIFITSSYRSPVENAASGGVPTSQHILGKAVDIVIPASHLTSLTKLHEFFIKAVGAGFNAFGVYYPELIAHLDTRDPKADGSAFTWGRIGGRHQPYISYSQAMQRIAESLQTDSQLTLPSKKTFIFVLTIIGIVLLVIYLTDRN